jgi:hypothetical protein
MIQKTLSIADRGLEFVGRGTESAFRQCRHAPHYQFLVLPFYKYCAARVGKAAATAITFLVGDLLFHQALGAFIECNFILKDHCDFVILWQITLFWCAVALPVIYVKFKREKLAASGI